MLFLIILLFTVIILLYKRYFPVSGVKCIDTAILILYGF